MAQLAQMFDQNLTELNATRELLTKAERDVRNLEQTVQNLRYLVSSDMPRAA